jgi:type I restriction enzyme S subunit
LLNFEVETVSPETAGEVNKLIVGLEDKIELNHQINQTLEEIAQAIFKSWFVDFEPVKAKIEAKVGGQDPERAAMCAISGKTDAELDQLPPDQYAQLRTTAALFPDEFTDSELGLIPKGWEVRKIEDIIKRFPVGKKYAQKTASEKGDVPILDQGKSGIIGYHNDKPGVTASPDEPIIVFANHTCYMRLIMHDFSAIQNVLPFRGIDLDIYWVYGATFGKQEFVEYKGHWPDFVIKDVVVPDNKLDEKYGEHVGSFFKAIYQNNLQSFSLTQLRDTLLPKLLSGEISIDSAQAVIEAES